MALDLFNLKGRKALVTGSSRGIGRAIALGLARCGVDLIIHCSSNVAKAECVAKEAEQLGVRATALAADLGASGQAEYLFDRAGKILGEIDILVLNASVQYKKHWLEVTGAEFDQQVTVNLKTSLELMQLFVPAMLNKGWGRILTIGSVQQVKPHPEMIVYSSTKVAQMNLVKTIAKDVAGAGITVNNLSPGVIETDRNREALLDPKYQQQVLAAIPCGFTGRADDCVAAALLLCSEEARYITGIDLLVDGGMNLS
jgi:glucose 1-dehydrogenase